MAWAAYAGYADADRPSLKNDDPAPLGLPPSDSWPWRTPPYSEILTWQDPTFYDYGLHPEYAPEGSDLARLEKALTSILQHSFIGQWIDLERVQMKMKSSLKNRSMKDRPKNNGRSLNPMGASLASTLLHSAP